eukprot:scaffold14090_cov106-Isochrysis_galbana.AAC.3
MKARGNLRVYGRVGEGPLPHPLPQNSSPSFIPFPRRAPSLPGSSGASDPVPPREPRLILRIRPAASRRIPVSLSRADTPRSVSAGSPVRLREVSPRQLARCGMAASPSSVHDKSTVVSDPHRASCPMPASVRKRHIVSRTDSRPRA